MQFSLVWTGYSIPLAKTSLHVFILLLKFPANFSKIGYLLAESINWDLLYLYCELEINLPKFSMSYYNQSVNYCYFNKVMSSLEYFISRIDVSNYSTISIIFLIKASFSLFITSINFFTSSSVVTYW